MSDFCSNNGVSAQDKSRIEDRGSRIEDRGPKRDFYYNWFQELFLKPASTVNVALRKRRDLKSGKSENEDPEPLIEFGYDKNLSSVPLWEVHRTNDQKDCPTEFKRAHEKSSTQSILEIKFNPENKAKVAASDPVLNLGKAKV